MNKINELDPITEKSVNASFYVRQIGNQMYGPDPDIPQMIKMKKKVNKLLAELIGIAKENKK